MEGKAKGENRFRRGRMIGKIIDVIFWALVSAGLISAVVIFFGIVVVVLLADWRDDDGDDDS